MALNSINANESIDTGLTDHMTKYPHVHVISYNNFSVLGHNSPPPPPPTHTDMYPHDTYPKDIYPPDTNPPKH